MVNDDYLLWFCRPEILARHIRDKVSLIHNVWNLRWDGWLEWMKMAGMSQEELFGWDLSSSLQVMFARAGLSNMIPSCTHITDSWCWLFADSSLGLSTSTYTCPLYLTWVSHSMVAGSESKYSKRHTKAEAARLLMT